MAISPLDRRADPLTGEEAALVAEIRHRVRPLRGPDDLDPLMERIGDARYVLLGEASHGTADYYNWRAQITRRLIEEKGFSFLAVEGDWPDCERINRYVRGYADSGASGKDVLHAFAQSSAVRQISLNPIIENDLDHLHAAVRAPQPIWTAVHFRGSPPTVAAAEILRRDAIEPASADRSLDDPEPLLIILFRVPFELREPALLIGSIEFDHAPKRTVEFDAQSLLISDSAICPRQHGLLLALADFFDCCNYGSDRIRIGHGEIEVDRHRAR